MARFYFISLALLLALQVQKKPGLKLPAPSSGIRLQENLYMDKGEVANAQWLRYLHHLRQDSSEEAYKRALPDTSVWNEVNKSGYLQRQYLRSYRYWFYPVVGISYEQAQAYNRWRSAMATRDYNIRNKKKLKRKGLANYKVVLTWRLPTAAEWEMAAAGGLDPESEPYGIRKKHYVKYIKENSLIIDSLGYARPELEKTLRRHLRRHPIPAYNCLMTFGQGFRYGLFMTHPVPHIMPTAPGTPVFQRTLPFSQPNAKGFYDIIGNVAEMIDEKGKAKGGSWLHFIDYAKVGMTQTYTSPTAWLGFRSVCEVSLEPVEVSSPVSGGPAGKAQQKPIRLSDH